MRLGVLVIVAAITLGCGRSEPPTPLAPVPPLISTTRVTRVLMDGVTTDITERIEPATLVGSYYLGDGMGYNLHLTLDNDDRFECTWTGCLGVYGKSSGHWSMHRDGLRLATEKAEDMLKDQPLERLKLISLEGHYLLLQESDKDWFAKYGPDTFACFHQKEARDTLYEFWHRRIHRSQPQ